MKKNVTFMCDEELWQRAKYELPVSRSEFIENQLRAYLDYEVESDQILIEKIKKRKAEVGMLEDKLAEIHKKKERQTRNKELFDKSLNIVERIISIHGKIGINQLKDIAKQQNIPFDVFIKHCNNAKVNIVEKFELPTYSKKIR